jgi:hypothetical protein
LNPHHSVFPSGLTATGLALSKGSVAGKWQYIFSNEWRKGISGRSWYRAFIYASKELKQYFSHIKSR